MIQIKLTAPKSASQVTDAEFDLNQWFTVQCVVASSLDERETGYESKNLPLTREPLSFQLLSAKFLS